MAKYQYHTGFTLIELLMTMLIVGIVASFAFNSNSDLLERDRAESYLLELKRHIIFARSKATTSDEIVILCPANEENVANINNGINFNCSNNWSDFPVVSFVDVSDSGNFQANTDQLLRITNTVQGLDEVDINGTTNQFLRFDGSGRNTDTNAMQIIYCPNEDNNENQNNQMLTVNLGGRPIYAGDTNERCN